jgi:hypothetical protein
MTFKNEEDEINELERENFDEGISINKRIPKFKNKGTLLKARSQFY